MFIYEKYILKKLIVVFLLTVLFFTALLFIFNFFRIARHITAGVEFWLVFRLFLYLVPSLLGFSIPFGTLVAGLLVYGKLSAQNEILALRANGVSLSRAASAMAMLAAGTFLLAVLVFGVVTPMGNHALRRLRNELGRINPLFLFEPGETINVFPGYSIYVERKRGSILRDVHITHVSKEGITIRIDAKTAAVQHHPEAGTVILKLDDVTSRMRKSAGRELWEEKDKVMEVEFDLAGVLQRAEGRKDESDMTFRELLARTAVAKENGEDSAIYTTELNKRLVLSFACLSLAMVGAPLGMRIRRGEKTVGIAIGMTLAMSFYAVVTFAEKLRNNPSLHPQVLMWLPNAVLVLLGLLFFRRVRRGL